MYLGELKMGKDRVRHSLGSCAGKPLPEAFCREIAHGAVRISYREPMGNHFFRMLFSLLDVSFSSFSRRSMVS